MDFIIYDLEATCWRGAPPNNVQEVIEIGAIKINGYGEEIGSFNRFVRPYVNTQLSAFCTELTGIEQSNVESAELFPQVIDLFWEWLDLDNGNYTLVSWGSEDQALLRNDCQLHQLEHDWLAPHLNLKNAYRSIKRLNRPTGLLRTLEREGLEFDGRHHRAIDDAINTSKIFIKYLDEWPY
ncbi:MAG: exonuclease domain-containing protein [Saprospiraceae bacterium]|nr:exonuclease domain-containing protein [Saprospiraceae bacterium]